MRINLRAQTRFSGFFHHGRMGQDGKSTRVWHKGWMLNNTCSTSQPSRFLSQCYLVDQRTDTLRPSKFCNIAIYRNSLCVRESTIRNNVLLLICHSNFTMSSERQNWVARTRESACVCRGRSISASASRTSRSKVRRLNLGEWRGTVYQPPPCVLVQRGFGKVSFLDKVFSCN